MDCWLVERRDGVGKYAANLVKSHKPVASRGTFCCLVQTVPGKTVLTDNGGANRLDGE